MHVLVIAPHMDDEVLGCGATIARHVEEGSDVAVCIVANRAYDHAYEEAQIQRERQACEKAKECLGYQELYYLGLPDEQLDARLIDVIVPIEKVFEEVSPDVLYVPHRGDYHQDHRAVAEAMRVVARPYAAARPRAVRAYETSSSTGMIPAATDWPFLPNWYVNAAGTLDRKLAAMQCYETEGRPYPHPRSLEGIRIQAQRRGMEVGLEAAEAFMTLREMWS
ncbi:MAG: PIG-L family deacetylase [bacterium]|nr:PIG-L family deacetylase [bacterium]